MSPHRPLSRAQSSVWVLTWQLLLFGVWTAGKLNPNPVKGAFLASKREVVRPKALRTPDIKDKLDPPDDLGPTPAGKTLF